jgi:GTP-binding protein HflX
MAPRASHAPILVSAVTGEGVETLLRAIDERLAENNKTLTIEVPAEAGALMHWLHGNAEVLDRQTSDTGATVYRIRIGEALRGRLAGQMKRAGLAPPV